MTRCTTPVSVGLVAFNGEPFIADAIGSLLDQTFADFELLILDNASTDRTRDICRAYAARDTRVRYLRNERNIGAAANCNRAFSLSHGRYFKWAAHDDVCAPSYLARCVEVLDKEPSVVLCHTETRYINHDGTPARLDEASGRFIDNDGVQWSLDTAGRMDSARVSERFNDLLLHTVNSFEIFGVIRRAALQRTSLFRRYYASDRALLAELILQGRAVRIQDALFLRRCHAKQASRQSIVGRARVVDPETPEWVRCTGWRNVLAYLSAVWKARMSPMEKARCFGTLVRLAVSRGTLRKIFVPGPYNYFGIDRKNRPYGYGIGGRTR